MLTHHDPRALLEQLATPLLVLSTATVTSAYYQVHGPTLHALMLASLGWLVLRGGSRPEVRHPGSTRLLSAIFALYALLAVLSAARTGFNAPALDRLEHFSYFLAGAVLLPFLVAARPTPGWFWPAVGAAALLSGLYAGWEVWKDAGEFEAATGMPFRAAGSKGKAIPFGDLAVLATALSALGACVFLDTRWRWSGLLFICTVFGLYAAFASGTRSAWVYLPVALVVILVYLVQRFPLRRRLILAGALALSLPGALLFGFAASIQERFTDAFVQIHGYLSGEPVRAGNAMGERFEMWQSAWSAFRGHPWLGIGVGQLNAHLREAVDQGLISHAIAEFDGGTGHTHAHNDYLHVLATRGLVGLTSMLAIYLAPLVVFVRTTVRQRAPAARGLGYAGILTILAYMLFSLTDSVLLMRITGGFFVLITCWLLALCLGLEET